MCLKNIRIPTEEERNEVHIGYKIVQKCDAKGVFRPTISKIDETLYQVGKETLSSRDHVTLHQNEIEQSEVYEGIHFYTSSEMEKYPFEPEEHHSLIKIEVQGQDLIAFGEGPHPCRCPCRYPRPCRYRSPCLNQAVAIKVKVLEEIKEDGTESSKE